MYEITTAGAIALTGGVVFVLAIAAFIASDREPDAGALGALLLAIAGVLTIIAIWVQAAAS